MQAPSGVCALCILCLVTSSSSVLLLWGGSVELRQLTTVQCPTPSTKQARTCRREHARRCAGSGSTDSGRGGGRGHVARSRGGAPGGAGAPQLFRAGAGRRVRGARCERRQAPSAWQTAQPERAPRTSTGDVLQALQQQQRAPFLLTLNPSGRVVRRRRGAGGCCGGGAVCRRAAAGRRPRAQLDRLSQGAPTARGM